MSHAKSRLAVDLDEIERQLSYSAPAPAPRKGDPLAELARIVGQDDPFRSLLAEGGPRRQTQSHQVQGHQIQGVAPEPAADPGFPAGLPERPAPAAPVAEPPLAVQARPAPAYPDRAALRADLRAEADDASADYHMLADDHAPRPRSRKGLIAAGALMGVAVVGVSGAMMMRAGDRAAGEPVVVQAERTPLKVQPQNPGGAVIPDQNRQIYQPGSPDGQIKVVNREEQPVDVRSAAAAAAPAPATASALIGEPRKVRTVAVRPDGSLAGSHERPAAPATTQSVQPTTTSAIPAASTPAASAQPRPQQAETRTAPQAAASTRPNAAPATTPQPQPRPAQRVAAAAPPAAEPAPAPGRGNFVVQLSSSPSETDAKAKAGQLRQKFADALGGQSPFVRRAEVNGATTYRVRVGPMSRDDATSLCTRVKEAGGACIVAAN